MELEIYNAFVKAGVSEADAKAAVESINREIDKRFELHAERLATKGDIETVRKELAEAAEIDGCTRWQAFWKVEFPVARAGIASAGIFAFLTSWNEYALASQLTRSVQSKTMPVGLMDFTSQFTLNWGGMCALAVLMIIPAAVLTFLVQKHLIAGLTFGGVKG